MTTRLYLPGLMMVLLAGVLDVSMVHGTPVCTPEQWEGLQVIYAGYVQDKKPGTIRDHRRVYYDAKNKRKARFVTYVNGDFQDQFQIVQLFGDKKGIEYMADIKKGTCYTETILEPFKPHCIPDGAKMVDSYHVGLKSSGIPVSTYTHMMKDGGEMHIAVTKAGDNIVPISETLFGNSLEFGMPAEYFEAGQFGDITTGITNATVFDIPKECKQEQDLTVIEKLMRRRHAVFGF